MDKQQRVLTGITTSGMPHLGNLVGAVLPAIKASNLQNTSSFLFLADYHSLIKNTDSDLTHSSSFEIAACWLACGLDPNKVIFYRQSDIPHIFELAWILGCLTSKGLLNRAHAYKAAISDNEEKGIKDIDKGITMGLFNYPILMAADILMFSADIVPVGQDQKQHIEMARDIALKFNHHYGELLTPPEAQISEVTGVLPGLDGRKMSKSYNNTIPIFADEKKLRKTIMKIKTNSLEPIDIAYALEGMEGKSIDGGKVIMRKKDHQIHFDMQALLVSEKAGPALIYRDFDSDMSYVNVGDIPVEDITLESSCQMKHFWVHVIV